MIRQFKIFLAALGFFTRLKIPAAIAADLSLLNKVYLYAPYAGLVVGILAALEFYLLALFLPSIIAIVLVIIFTLLLTGAFHEDGLADVCDGFGGCWGKENILKIMKDSAIGTYGALGLLLAIAIKIFLLNVFPIKIVPLVLICAHVLSRSVAIAFTYRMEYSRTENSKTSSALMSVSFLQMLLVLLPGLISLLLFNNVYLFIAVFLLTAFSAFFRKYLKVKIGGYTGDCLGAVQQISEILIYLSFVILSYNNLSLKIL